MKLRLTIDVSDDYRAAVNYGLVFGRQASKATRVQMERHIKTLVEANSRVLVDEYNRDPDVRRKKARKLNNLGPDLRMRVQT